MKEETFVFDAMNNQHQDSDTGSSSLALALTLTTKCNVGKEATMRPFSASEYTRYSHRNPCSYSFDQEIKRPYLKTDILNSFEDKTLQRKVWVEAFYLDCPHFWNVTQKLTIFNQGWKETTYNKQKDIGKFFYHKGYSNLSRKKLAYRQRL